MRLFLTIVAILSIAHGARAATTTEACISVLEAATIVNDFMQKNSLVGDVDMAANMFSIIDSTDVAGDVHYLLANVVVTAQSPELSSAPFAVNFYDVCTLTLGAGK